MLSALAYVLQRAMAQQKMIESAKLAPMPDLVQSNKDVAINFFGDMEICTRKGVLSERFFNSPKSSRVVTYIILNPKTAHPPTGDLSCAVAGGVCRTRGGQQEYSRVYLSIQADIFLDL